MTTELPFRFFDCDNHYYEAVDAFTRHLEPAYRKRGMQWAQVDGKPRLLVGGDDRMLREAQLADVVFVDLGAHAPFAVVGHGFPLFR